MNKDNGKSQEARQVRQESEFIKRIDDFARYMGPEYITNSNQPRSLCIIAADCLDLKHGTLAMAHVMMGNNHVGRCALRSMMEGEEVFSAQVHELCNEDGSNRSVEDLDKEIASKRGKMKRSVFAAVMVAAWSAALVVLQVVGIAKWITTVSSLLLMAWLGMLVGCEIMSLRKDIARLRQLRKRAKIRQKSASRISEFSEFLSWMISKMGDNASDDE